MYRLDISKPFSELPDDKISINKAGKQIANIIRKAYFFQSYKETLEPIAKKFERANTITKFDNAMEKLYDFGDTETSERVGVIANRLCWIQTLPYG